MTDRPALPDAVEAVAHSPLPWATVVWPAGRTFVVDAFGTNVLYEHSECRPNAEFICRAVNSHQQLVDALNTIEALICDTPLCGHFTAEEIRSVVHAALSSVSADRQE